MKFGHGMLLNRWCYCYLVYASLLVYAFWTQALKGPNRIQKRPKIRSHFKSGLLSHTRPRLFPRYVEYWMNPPHSKRELVLQRPFFSTFFNCHGMTIFFFVEVILRKDISYEVWYRRHHVLQKLMRNQKHLGQNKGHLAI